MPTEVQEAMVAAARKGGANFTTRSLDAGYNPFLNKPNETVELILEALREFNKYPSTI